MVKLVHFILLIADDKVHKFPPLIFSLLWKQLQIIILLYAI
jgi:hypothetical protein